MIIEKHIQAKIERDYFFIKGTLKDINIPYFIDKIDKGIQEPTNMNFKTNINGCMTSFEYFNNDIEFAKIMNQILNYIDQKKVISRKCHLKACWGLKEGFGNFTREHDHAHDFMSGVVYCSKVSQSLVFPQINETVEAKEGSFAVFSSFLKHRTNKRIDEFEYKYGLAFNFVENSF